MAAHLIESLWVTGYGTSAASGYAFFYQPGTMTPVSVYSNDAATTVVTQPVRLDANGRSSAPLYVKAPARAIIQNSNGATLADIERIDGDRAELVALANSSWPNSSTENAAWTALAASLGGTDGNFKAAGAGAVGRTITGRLSEQISVKDFGAKGDGITDDTAPLVAALLFASSQGGGIVYLPPGTYPCSQTLVLTNGTTLCGAGENISSIQNTSSTNNLISIAGLTSVFLRDVQLTALSSSSGAGISMTGNNFYVVFERVEVLHHRTGISQPSGIMQLFSIRECTIICDGNAAANGINLLGSQSTASIVGNYIDTGAAGQGNGIVVSGALDVSHNNVVASSVGITVTAGHATLAENGITGTTTYAGAGVGVVLGGSIITANSTLKAAVVTPSQGIWFSGHSGVVTSVGTTSAYTPNNTQYDYHRIRATAAGITITVNAPTQSALYPLASNSLTYVFDNASGGAVTWTIGAGLRIAAVAPANGFLVAVTVVYDQTLASWIEVSRGSAA